MRSCLKSINTIISMVISMVLLLTLGGLVMYVSNSTHAAVVANQMASMTQLAEGLVKQTESYMDDSMSVADSLARQKQIVEFLREGAGEAVIGDILDSQLKSRQGYETVFLFNKEGRIMAGSDARGSALKGADISGRAYVQECLQKGQPRISEEIVKSKVSGELVFVVAVPVKDGKGAVLGGAAVATNWTKFIEHNILPVRVGAQGYAYFLDPKGTAIAHPNKERLLQDLTKFDFVKDTITKKKGSLQYMYEGQAKTQVFEPISRTGWIVCVNATEAELTRMAVEQRNLLIVIGAVSYVALLLIILMGLRKLVVQPLGRIKNFSSEIAGGNLNAGLTGSFSYEMKDLSENILRMTDELKNKIGFTEGVLKGIATPFVIVDTEEVLKVTNENLLALLEHEGKPEDFYGQNVAYFFYGDASRKTVLGMAVAERRAITREVELTSRKGRKRHVRINSTPLFNSVTGDLMGALCVYADLTDLRMQEAQVLEQNRKIGEAVKVADTISDRLSTAAEELAAQIDESSRGTEHQRERLGETTTAVEQMNSSVMEVAKNSSDAAFNAEEARKKAETGEQVVSKAVSAFKRVESSTVAMKGQVEDLSQRASGIGSIMQIIEDIADQTNLLALNAAIEAARAGDAGRGFAVVADEVRKLAEKTMTATKDVGTSIRDIQGSIAKALQHMDETGGLVVEATALSAESGQALHEIVTISEKSASQIQSIATAAEEQSAASEQIARSADEVSVIASETAEAMNQSAHAVSELARMAGELKDLIRDMQS